MQDLKLSAIRVTSSERSRFRLETVHGRLLLSRENEGVSC